VLHLSLHNADGEPITDEPTTIPVNATGLGSGALLISGIAALVLVVALAPRAVRKWRRDQARKTQAAIDATAAAQEDSLAAVTGERADDTDSHSPPGPVKPDQDGESAEEARS